jgi:acyl-CoA synthetase (AMP-forming)/AMP-acid ligase II/cytochrome P450/acyl carrier protein
MDSSPKHPISPSSWSLFSEILPAHALVKPDATAYTFLKDDTQAVSISYREFELAASRIATELLKQKEGEGSALLLFPPGIDFIKAFIGCALAGVPSVPLSIPRARQSLSGLEKIANDCGARVVLCTRAISDILKSRIPQGSPLDQLVWIPVDELNHSDCAIFTASPAQPSSPIFLQYTSGSTGSPKGVVVSNENLLHNLRNIASLYNMAEGSKVVSWLPHFHDMGLVGAILTSLYAGIPCILLSPNDFIQKPYRWLKAISDYGGTLGGAPNFAYDLCVSKISAGEVETLDLRSWMLAWNGAETIRASTISAFSEHFRKTGFTKKAFAPCYGLAEATLMVTGCGPHTEKKTISITRSSHLSGESVDLVTIPSAETQELVGCGKSFPDQSVRIADATTLVSLPDLKIGEIMVKGPSISNGYWNNIEASAPVFDNLLDGEAGFLRTGDLGFLHQGELFVVGRVKETMKLNGKSFYAYDIEFTACDSNLCLKKNGAAAFSIQGREGELLVVICEIRRDRLKSFDGEEIRKAIAQAIFDEHNVTVHDIVLIRPATLPMTSSGKIKRLQCRALYLQNSLEPLYTSRSLLMSKNSNPAALTHQTLVDLPPDLRQKSLLANLKVVTASLVNCDPAMIDASQNLHQEIGLDSIRLIELKVHLDLLLGNDFPLEKFAAIETLGELAKESIEYLTLEKTPSKVLSEICPGPSYPQDLVVLEKIQNGFFEYLLQLREQYGRVVRFVWGSKTIYMLSEPEDVREIFVKRTEEFIRGDIFIGIRLTSDLQNVFSAEGAEWKVQRDMAQPLFTRAAIETFCDTIPERVLDCLCDGDGRKVSREVDLTYTSREITLRIILGKLLGINDKDRVKCILESLTDVDNFQVPYFYIFSHKIKNAPIHNEKLRLYFDPLIYEHIDQHLDHPDQYEDILASYIATDFVKAMPRAEQRIYLRSMVFTYILAGFESTGSGLFSTLFLLASHPEKLRKVREEVLSAFPDSQLKSQDVLSKLPYTYAAVNEALRLYPPVWFNGREATQDTTFRGIPIQKGDFMLTSPYVIQRNPVYWENPSEFLPERFLEKNVPMGAYVPWGSGPRLCAGKWLALFELIIATATIVRNYDLNVTCEGEFELTTFFTLRPKNTFRATFTPIP